MKLSGKRCYVALDEFQQIQYYPQEGLEALLRSYIQFLPNVYFIFSGSRQHMMEEMFLSANRPFFQSAMVMSLGSIKTALRALEDKMLISRSATDGYSVSDKLFALWLVQG